MIQQFLEYIQQNQLFSTHDKILVAVSGGIDSVVLARLFSETDFSFAIAHCNFGLRAEESDADEKFVRKLARKLKSECYVKNFDTLAFAEKEKISTQMAARQLRYQWFDELRKEFGFTYIATAHHKNDITETILLNLTRGTGIAGLHGIHPKRGHVVRPLLFASKDDIYDYVTENQVIWREDSSNYSTKYTRNKIRKEVIPILKEINPRLEETFAQTAEKIMAVETIFWKQLDKIKMESFSEQDGSYIIKLQPLQNSIEPTLFLSELIEPFGFNYQQAQTIWRTYTHSNTASGKIFESATYKLNLDRETLLIDTKNLEEFSDVEINEEEKEVQYHGLTFLIDEHSAENYTININPKVAGLDKGKLQFPLKLRRWKEGDWFCPLGMSKKKKLSDFMIDEKIPVNLKDKVIVLTSGDSIVWVVGQRIDNRFKLTDKTEEVYEITLLNHV